MSATPPHIHEPPDLEPLSEEDQYREVYAWAGLALYFAQVAEQAAVHTFFFAGLADPTFAKQFPSWGSFDKQTSAQTFGKVLTSLRRHLAVPADLDARCTDALRLRNFIAHRFFVERIELFGTRAGRQLLIQELHRAASVFSVVNDELEVLMLTLSTKYGVTRDRIEEQAKVMMRNAGWEVPDQ